MSGGCRLSVRRAALVVAAVSPLLAPWRAVEAQHDTRVIAGRVIRAAPDGGTVPVVGAWVVLHRVGSDAAAPMDSTRTRTGGAYAFRYRPVGDTAAVYFVATSRGGIAYFTPPTTEAALRGGAADLMVYDTTSAPVPITVRGRHLVVTAPDAETPRLRTVIEVYELSNDTLVTLVPGDARRFTFRVALPDGVPQVFGGEGDLSPDAIRLEDGEVRLYAPIAPGLKQFSFRYTLPLSAAPMRFPFEGSTPVLEVLVEDPRGTATGAGLLEVTPVFVEGRPFKRFLAQDVVGPHVVDVSAPGARAGASRIRLLLIATAVSAALLLGLGGALMRRGPGAFRRRREDDPDALEREIAALDAEFSAQAAPSEDARSAHLLRRAHLTGRLHAALAKRDGLT
ncbi:MAG: hypothetical protein WD771_09555 [Gemmatimonadaceae bacterium]